VVGAQRRSGHSLYAGGGTEALCSTSACRVLVVDAVPVQAVA
jgi:hypothetical protein